MDVGVNWNKRSNEQQQKIYRLAESINWNASEKKKVAALTETGQEGITNEKCLRKWCWNPFKTSRYTLAWFLVWRNANEKHHYAPYPGHAATDNFIKFYQDPISLFESDIKDMYKTHWNDNTKTIFLLLLIDLSVISIRASAQDTQGFSLTASCQTATIPDFTTYTKPSVVASVTVSADMSSTITKFRSICLVTIPICTWLKWSISPAC